MHTINLSQKLATFSQAWVPKIVGELNGQYVKVAKFLGEYVWHHHADEDEMFLILDGHVDIHVRDPNERCERVIRLDPGEFCVIPRGVEHKPVAEKLSSVLLFEPAATRNTGNVDHRYSIEAADLERI